MLRFAVLAHRGLEHPPALQTPGLFYQDAFNQHFRLILAILWLFLYNCFYEQENKKLKY
jgi:hypothetical protein